MKNLVAIFTVLAVLAVTILVLYSIWGGKETNLALIGKALVSYLVIITSAFITTKYIDILDKNQKDK